MTCLGCGTIPPPTYHLHPVFTRFIGGRQGEWYGTIQYLCAGSSVGSSRGLLSLVSSVQVRVGVLDPGVLRFPSQANARIASRLLDASSPGSPRLHSPMVEALVLGTSKCQFESDWSYGINCSLGRGNIPKGRHWSASDANARAKSKTLAVSMVVPVDETYNRSTAWPCSFYWTEILDSQSGVCGFDSRQGHSSVLGG